MRVTVPRYYLRNSRFKRIICCVIICPQKVKVVTPVSLKLNVSKTVRERRLDEIDYQ